jgi:hypothetical protein
MYLPGNSCIYDNYRILIRLLIRHNRSLRVPPLCETLNRRAFTVHGPGIGHDSALIHSAIEVRWNDRWSSFVGYDGNVGRGSYDSNAVSGGLTYQF